MEKRCSSRPSPCERTKSIQIFDKYRRTSNLKRPLSCCAENGRSGCARNLTAARSRARVDPNGLVEVGETARARSHPGNAIDSAIKKLARYTSISIRTETACRRRCEMLNAKWTRRELLKDRAYAAGDVGDEWGLGQRRVCRDGWARLQLRGRAQCGARHGQKHR